MDYVVETHGIDLDRPGIEVLGDVIERTWLRYGNKYAEWQVMEIAQEVFDVLAMNLHIDYDEMLYPIIEVHRSYRQSTLPNAYVEGERAVDFKLNGKRRPGQ